ncbi:MAG: sodium-translocating pyrophosphatase [Vicinamibacterales bacterium]|jgi:K(+)-stimulated pyrophosphate-energized sodium pump|nr:sodium-translocating pyrophosphatase [Acidobacteriota bacterium]MDP6372477.1 sodium-translocating pyrophosphatase [Vicinamibacterales bacterium]MDP6608896.1 sodium-translocating pyrophosphatase [Vicinamibacterales bacterium]HAK54251.1 sodium-translocating pyrophosphatase [Acidobacteriota bacterium]|tara:strand:- start:11385 stop:13493 length:2109 start_codon:yes stop_codon:yes gene_type:complete
MGQQLFVIFGIGAPICAAIFAFILIQAINKRDAGTDRMKSIAALIRSGAMAFLRVEYSVLAVFVAAMFIVLAVFLPRSAVTTAVAFLVGATLSACAGWVGMRTATGAAVRTTQAAKTSLASALRVAFSSGAVMGLTVVALGTLGIAILYSMFGGLDGAGPAAVESLFGLSLGASSIALFARVGGGIYTKAADVGADLSGKVEAGIPEDDPRNPATIADAVGDNVGDVAGMGADLFESYVGSIISSIALAWAMSAASAQALWGTPADAFDQLQGALVLFPVVLAGVGIICSIVGTFAVRTNDEKAIQGALNRGLFLASILVVLAAGGLVSVLELPMAILWCVIAGLGSGVAIGKLTEYYTAKDLAPAQRIAQQSETGPATNIIAGLGIGMMSCGGPTLVICLAIFLSFDWAGLYGIAIAAVGMLSTLGISLGVDAYGPVADNAGGIAELSGCEPFVRERTDALDAVGNTTAAIGKGFAIGSAALTALALFSTYRATADAAIEAAGGVGAFNTRLLSLNLDNPNVLLGMFIGGMLPFIFSALTMNAVGRSANKMIEEVRRQFQSIPGLLEGKAEPDSAQCVAISTKAAIREMLAPGLLAVIAPIATGFILGVAGLGGLLGGSLVTGVLMALMMANAGGAWDNAKKFIEEGNLGGKGSEPHKAAVIGDTVGDPFKDTAGPSLNILIKLMSIVSVIFAPLVVGWML